MIKDSDAHMFADILKRRKEVDSSFCYAHELAEENRLKNVFWCDSLCRRSYVLFGKLLSFDTKHKTNRYSMVFALFMGINHNHQLTCFGAGFIQDEKVKSFKWLLQCFIDAMGGKKPKAVIIDQDPAIRQGVLSVFEGCSHRYCMWHIIRKLPEKVRHLLSGCEDFLEQIKLCVQASDTQEEFEAKWEDMLIEFNLGSNDQLKHIYVNREDWVQVYFKEDFLGGIMRTTLGSESQNALAI